MPKNGQVSKRRTFDTFELWFFFDVFKVHNNFRPNVTSWFHFACVLCFEIKKKRNKLWYKAYKPFSHQNVVKKNGNKTIQRLAFVILWKCLEIKSSWRNFTESVHFWVFNQHLHARLCYSRPVFWVIDWKIILHKSFLVLKLDESNAFEW